MFTVATIIVLAGIFGGVVTVALSEDWSGKALFSAVIAGVCASALVPVFLKTVYSGLLATVLSEKADQESRFVFMGFCLLAAVSARRFIQTLSERVLQEVREARAVAAVANENATEAQKQTIALEHRTAQIATETKAVVDAVSYNTQPSVKPGASKVVALDDIQAGPTGADPWKGAFGGRSRANGRTLEASLSPVDNSGERMIVTLRVVSDAQSSALSGAVQFFLHPERFQNPSPVVPVVSGFAQLTVITWGAFTVGAITDDGTKLELDLAEHPDAREPWRSR